jgi:hypothetical protein
VDNCKSKKSLGSYFGVPISETPSWCLLCSHCSSPSTKILLNIFLTKVPIAFELIPGLT